MVPLLPKIQGINNWRGKQMHSHNYRTPEQFRDEIVVIVGFGASGVDIAREISHVAKEVHIATRCNQDWLGKIESSYNNVWMHDEVDCIQGDGKVHFAEGSTLVADGLLYCTGYLYNFPFIDLDGFTLGDNRVGPLYKHVFPPKYAPSLSFIGIPIRNILFQTYELQSKWVARVLSVRGAALPSEEDMLASVQEHYREMEEAGKAKRHTHVVMPEWVEYMNWLADQVGEPHLEPRRHDVYEKALMCVFSVDEGYRDKWNKEEDEKNHTTS
ncbi:hypothetical protein HU200_026949 [Digitaria exilis]|uniref:Flavin-containing monooxygenase n=1 Tax=Digitaria exilis TaxID=1010633 RepID=A0A835C069_9POAL|nr:hypothetical protein HU200_026949 [Digitaria exilis]